MLAQPPERTYKPRGFLRALIILLLILPGLGMAAGGIADSNAVLTAFGAAFLGLGVWLWIASGRMEITIHSDGVRRKGLFGESELRWDQIVDYRWRSFVMHNAGHFGLVGALVGALASRNSSGTTGQEQIVLRLTARDGRTISITSNWADVGEAVQLLRDRVTERCLQSLAAEVQKGGDVTFGPVVLGRDQIKSGSKQATFTMIERVEIVQGALRVKGKGKFLALLSVNCIKVPNVFLLLDGLKARGVAVVDPRDAIVSNKGFLIGK